MKKYKVHFKPRTVNADDVDDAKMVTEYITTGVDIESVEEIKGSANV